MSVADDFPAGAEPVFRVLRGNPTAEELAALVGVLFARPRAAAPEAPAGPSPWVALARPGVGQPWRPGPGGWRLSGLPR